MKAIINATLVMRDHLIPEAALLIDGGKIAGFGEMHTTPIPEGCEIIDAGGLFAGPGLIDIHTHASDRVFFVDDPVAAGFGLGAEGLAGIAASLGGFREGRGAAAENHVPVTLELGGKSPQIVFEAIASAMYFSASGPRGGTLKGIIPP